MWVGGTAGRSNGAENRAVERGRQGRERAAGCRDGVFGEFIRFADPAPGDAEQGGTEECRGPGHVRDKRMLNFCLMEPLPCLSLLSLLLVLVPFRPSAHPGSGIVVDPAGVVFFTCGGGIVRVDATGHARIIAVDPQQAQFAQLHHLFIDAQRNLYTASDMGNAVWKVSPNDKVARFFPPPNEDRGQLIGLGGDPFCLDLAGNIFAVNSQQDKFTQVLKITVQGRVVMLVGGDWGHADGPAEKARFGDLHGGAMLLAADGSLYLTDDGRYLRKITMDGTVSTLAGGAERGYADGSGAQARFDGISGLTADGEGNIYVADYSNHRIRRINPQGVATTYAGAGRAGSADGPADAATFDHPTGVTFGLGGILCVLDADGSRVRKIAPDGSVTTLLKSVSDLR